MALNSSDIQKLARLSRIAVEPGSPSEAQILSRVNQVFALIAQLESVDLEGVEPLTHPQDVTLRLRDDIVTEVDQRAAIQKVAPATQDGLYLVPKVIE